jgi:hypothetical protein
MELKQRMTFKEMAEHMEENTYLMTSPVSVGLYAKQRGYKVYKPMRNGETLFFYVNENYAKKENPDESK